jgi:hypothetical protein
MRQKLRSAGLMLATLLATPGLGSSQAVQQNRILIVIGQPGQTPVLQIKGKSYVDVEALGSPSMAAGGQFQDDGSCH